MHFTKVPILRFSKDYSLSLLLPRPPISTQHSYILWNVWSPRESICLLGDLPHIKNNTPLWTYITSAALPLAKNPPWFPQPKGQAVCQDPWDSCHILTSTVLHTEKSLLLDLVKVEFSTHLYHASSYIRAKMSQANFLPNTSKTFMQNVPVTSIGRSWPNLEARIDGSLSSKVKLNTGTHVHTCTTAGSFNLSPTDIWRWL